MHVRPLVVAAVLVSLCPAAEAKKPVAPPPRLAPAAGGPAVKLFERGKAPVLVPGGLTLPAAALRNKLDRGVAAQAFLGWLTGQKARFGLRLADADTLPLRGVQQTPSGFTLRFVQRYARIHIDEAEVLAIFSRDGKLRAVSSSLVPTPAVSVRAELSETDALRALARVVDLDRVKKPVGDGLRLVRSGKGLRLAWRLSIWDRKQKLHAAALVAAAGPDKGKVLRADLLDDTAVAIQILDTGDLRPPPGGALNPSGLGTLLLDSGAQAPAAAAFATAHPADWVDAQALQGNLEKVLGFYAGLGRNSWDGAGAKVIAYIRESSCVGNAMWSRQYNQFYFCNESPRRRTAEKLLDFVGHEFTHGVVSTTAALRGGGEQGGLNEHLADMFGSMILHKNDPAADTTVWAAGFYKSGSPARIYLDPHKNPSPAPATMDEVRARSYRDPTSNAPAWFADPQEVHALAAVPDRALATAVRTITWEALAPVLYTVMTGRLRTDSGFDDYRDQLLDECGVQKQAICAALQAGFDLVGIKGHKPPAAEAPAVAAAPAAAPATTATTPAAGPTGPAAAPAGVARERRARAAAGR